MLTPGEMDQVVLDIARFGLRKSTTLKLDNCSDPEFDLLVQKLRNGRLLGMACAAYMEGELVLSDAHRDHLQAANRSAAALALELDSVCVQLVCDLPDAGITLLKGASHAVHDYPRPSWRDYGDLDLLVNLESMEEVVHQLGAYDFARSFPRVLPRWSSEFGKSVTVSRGALEVDLHRHLSQGLAVAIPPDELRSHRSKIIVGGVSVPTLDAPARLVHAAIHLVGGGLSPRMNGYRDVVQMASDPERVRAASLLAQKWRVSGALLDAIVASNALIGAVSEESLDAISPLVRSLNERARSWILNRSRFSFGGNLLAGIVAVQGTARVRYARKYTADQLSGVFHWAAADQSDRYTHE